MKKGLFEIYNSYREMFYDDNNCYDFFLDKNYSNLKFFFNIKNKKITINKNHKMYSTFNDLFNNLDSQKITINSSLNDFFINIIEADDSFIIEFNLSEKSEINYIEINENNELFSKALNMFISIVGILNNYNTFKKTLQK
jgi:hypothetical protein